MEPLGAAAAGIALVELTAKAVIELTKTTRRIKHARKERTQLLDEIGKSQHLVLHAIEMLGDEDPLEDDQLISLRKILDTKSDTFQDFRESLWRVYDKLQEANEEVGRFKIVATSVKWPFDQHEAHAILKGIKTLQGQIELALVTDTSNTVRTNLRETRMIARNQIKDQERRKLKEQEEEKLNELKAYLDWLVHPDPNSIYKIALNKYISKTSTGRWLWDNDAFQNFLERPQSMLWLRGHEGSGKTVLSAVIIQAMQDVFRKDNSKALAFWFFSAREKLTTSIDNMLRSLLCQLLKHPATKFPAALETLKTEKNTGRANSAIPPSSAELLGVIQQLLQENTSNSYYLVIDAINEAEAGYELTNVYKTLIGILASASANLHVLVTSLQQAESNIKELPIFAETLIEKYTKADIEDFVNHRLQEDLHFQSWSDKQRSVAADALRRTGQTFRFVDRSLEDLRAAKTPDDLEHRLASLPRNNIERYQKELDAIEADSAGHAIKLLQCLAYPQRKLTPVEVVEILAVDLESAPPRFRPSARMFISKVLDLGGSFVEREDTQGKDAYGTDATVTTLSLSQQTEITDFLTSKTVTIGGMKTSFSQPAVNLLMAETCLTYLDYIFEKGDLTEHNLSQYPFARYAAENWDDCYREAAAASNPSLDMTRVDGMVLQLLQNRNSMRTYVQLCDPEYEQRRAYYAAESSELSPPLYYASLHGLKGVVRALLKHGADPNLYSKSLYGTPLVAAVARGHDDVVTLLIEKGADPLRPGTEFWGAPLNAAIKKDQAQVGQTLLRQPTVRAKRSKMFADSPSRDKISYDWQIRTTNRQNVDVPPMPSVDFAPIDYQTRPFTTAPETDSNLAYSAPWSEGPQPPAYIAAYSNEPPPQLVTHHHTFPVMAAAPEQPWQQNGLNRYENQYGSQEPQVSQPPYAGQDSQDFHGEPQRASEYSFSDPSYSSPHALRTQSVPVISPHFPVPGYGSETRLPVSHPHSSSSSPGLVQAPPQSSPYLNYQSPLLAQSPGFVQEQQQQQQQTSYFSTPTLLPNETFGASNPYAANEQLVSNTSLRRGSAYLPYRPS